MVKTRGQEKAAERARTDAGEAEASTAAPSEGAGPTGFPVDVPATAGGRNSPVPSRPVSSVATSSNTIVQQLAAKARHARRLAEVEAEAERAAAAAAATAARRAAERERAVAELELQAELAAIESGSRRSRASSNASVERWLDASKNIVSGLGCQSTPPRSPPPEPEYTKHAFSEIGTQNAKYCTHNKVLASRTQNNEDQGFKRTLTDILKKLSHDKVGAMSNCPKDLRLPIFDGRASEFLLFRKLYEDSKSSFTPAWNLARLNAALRGAAREAVSALIVSADDPDLVIDELQRRFAQPDVIVMHEIAAIRALPKLPNEVGKELNSFASKVRNCVEIIRLMDRPEFLASPELFTAIVGKLTPMLRARFIDFAASRLDAGKTKLELMAEYLSREMDLHLRFAFLPDKDIHVDKNKSTVKVHAIDNSVASENDVEVESTQVSAFSSKEATPSMQSSSNYVVPLCGLCKDGKHLLNDCKKFLALSVDDRWQYIYKDKVCRKCLRPATHNVYTCRRQPFCKVPKCQRVRSHHTLLHRELELATVSQATCAPTSGAQSVSSDKKVKIHDESVTHSYPESSRPSPVLLKVVPITVTGPQGSVDTYALLDDGSTATLLDAEVAAAIGAQGPSTSIQVNCIGGLSKETQVSFVEVSVRGRGCSESYDLKNVRTISNLGLRPQTALLEDIVMHKHLEGIATKLSYESAKPTILIGADNWHLLLPLAVRRGSREQPVAVQTLLGWVVFGSFSSKAAPVDVVNHITLSLEIQKESLDDLIKQNYSLDSIGISKKDFITDEDKRAYDILKSTTSRLPSGRFSTGLLWRANKLHVPDSYKLAVSRFRSLESKFKKDEVYAQLYRENVNGTIAKGYAELCEAPPNPVGVTWYLPHFGVIHPQKKKLRVVHDAAARVGGVSLNSMLLSGPDLLQPLLSILMRFREGLVALNADIREMFPQTKIRVEDRDAQRFLWRNSPTEPISEYRMSSMIFGAVSSPFTAIYLKNLNAEENKSLYPVAAKEIITNHYMDDYLGSVSNAEEAALLARDIVDVHSRAGLEMRSWVSNSKQALRLLPDDARAPEVREVALGPSNGHVRVLGVTWDVKDDTLVFLRDLSCLPSVFTKRTVLSHLMKVYDPLGFLTPIIIRGRILFQQTWRLVEDWDCVLSQKFIDLWKSWFQDLQELSSGSIPRCYVHCSESCEVQLHVFADSSELAYACVAYWRFCYPDGSVKLALVAGKARLAPLKPVSIPRLELQAALIAVRLASYILEAHRYTVASTTYWGDSVTVLRWLRKDPRSFKPFVAHRVGEILERTHIDQWRYVPTALNVADDATRSNSKFQISSRWFSGPDFLHSPLKDWPKMPFSELMTSPDLGEMKPSEQVGVINSAPSLPSPVVADISRFSVWLRLLRASATVFLAARLFRCLLEKQRPNSKFLTPTDLGRAERDLLLRAQLDSFGEDYARLQSGIPLPSKSPLRKLDVKIGEDGLIALAGRTVAAAGIGQHQPHPVVLSASHHVTMLICADYHRKCAHANHETVVNEMRQRFFVFGLRPAVRRLVKACYWCKLRRGLPSSPPMGDLPACRLAFEKRPFTFTGLDYFGPVTVSIGRRREKRYVALFTCLTVRAVHLEVVSSLTSDSAIMALRRFIARRGCPARIYSDNGTSFVGANKVLRAQFEEDMQTVATNRRIEWHFIPPAAPFMGGCWERLVRSVKVSLSATLRDRAPSEETFCTVLLEAEALVNSRPLTHVSVDPGSEEAITPNHFLLGTSSAYWPLARVDDADLLRRVSYRKGLRLADHFWARWVKEYLPSLTPRPSAGPASPLKVGDVVVIGDGSLPRGMWPRGRVTAVYPGKDNVVRVADVATAAGLFRRPTKKLVVVDS